MAEALRRPAGGRSDSAPTPRRCGRIGCFVELHVEQGRGLVDLDRPVAVASDIWPHGRWRIDFTGEANHAGTTRLADRRDAMLGCAEVVLAARAAAESSTAASRRSARSASSPGGVNAIPSAATAWLDARGAGGRRGARRGREIDRGRRSGSGGRSTRSRGLRRRRSTAELITRLSRLLDCAGAGHRRRTRRRDSRPTPASRRR